MKRGTWCKEVKASACPVEGRGGEIPIVIEADGKEAKAIIDALLHSDDKTPFTEADDTPQTVTIPLEAYTQMLRSHTQIEMLRAAWKEGDAGRMMRAVFGFTADEKKSGE